MGTLSCSGPQAASPTSTRFSSAPIRSHLECGRSAALLDGQCRADTTTRTQRRSSPVRELQVPRRGLGAAAEREQRQRGERGHRHQLAAGDWVGPGRGGGERGSVGRASARARYRGASTVSDGSGVAVHVDSGSEGRGSEASEDDNPHVADIVATNLEELNSGHYKKLRFAFDDWEKSLETSLKRREYKEALRDAIRNEVYQVIGFYIVFQGVIFTAVAQASALRCQNWWTSFLLSLLTSVVTILVVLQKLQDFWALETTIASEIVTAKVLKNRISDVKLKVGPAKFDFKQHARDGTNSESSGRPGRGVQVYRFGVVTVLLCFSAVFLVSSWNILCHTGHSPSD